MTTKNGSGQVLASVAYSHDKAGRRTQARREDGSYWGYGYNLRGEVTGAQRYSAAETAINGLERQYDYDSIGNRKWAKSGGGASGALSQTTYTPNDLNQFDSIVTPNKAWVVGRAPPGDTVQVNSVAAGRQDGWFSRELTVANSTGPVGESVTVADAGGITVASGKLEIRQQSASKSAGTLDYDAAGNLVKDGRWEYQWDSENRLRQMKATTAAVSGGLTAETIDFVYDWQGKRIGKKVTQGPVIRQTRYLYEGWNVVAEWTLHGSSTTLATPQTYLWGLDLAGQQSGNIGQLQGAGGVGGLLAVDIRKVSDATAAGKLYASYDGNGNILAWSGADGVVRRSQDYDAFGNVVLKNTDAVTGPLAVNQGEVGYGFSTKPAEKESGLLYYGYRYYDPVMGRWSSRDPLGELGGVNLYRMIDSINQLDFLGLVLKKYKGPVDIKRVAQLPESRAAITGAGWHPNLVVEESKKDGCRLKITGSLNIEILALKDVDLSKKGASAHATMSMEAHERAREAIWKKHWNAASDKTKDFERLYASVEAANIAMTKASDIINVYYLLAVIEQNKLTLREYPDLLTAQEIDQLKRQNTDFAVSAKAILENE